MTVCQRCWPRLESGHAPRLRLRLDLLFPSSSPSPSPSLMLAADPALPTSSSRYRRRAHRISVAPASVRPHTSPLCTSHAFLQLPDRQDTPGDQCSARYLPVSVACTPNPRALEQRRTTELSCRRTERGGRSKDRRRRRHGRPTGDASRHGHVHASTSLTAPRLDPRPPSASFSRSHAASPLPAPVALRLPSLHAAVPRNLADASRTRPALARALPARAS